MKDSELSTTTGFRGLVEKAMPKWKTIIFHDPCTYCGGTSDSKEHVVPTSLGGRFNECNTVGSCAACNSKRRSAPFLVWLAHKRGRLVNPLGVRVEWDSLSEYFRTGYKGGDDNVDCDRTDRDCARSTGPE